MRALHSCLEVRWTFGGLRGAGEWSRSTYSSSRVILIANPRTLQELLAPRVVEFYDHNWKLLGTKVSLAEPIAIRTGIEKFYLKDRIVVQDASVATRFSWASTRETTRAEDVAYCLLGLMDVNMPLLYGEGTKAFYRLQAELLKKTNEHTIFAWRLCRKYLWKYFGMLAPSPAYFAESADIVSSGIVVDKEHHITNRGLRIQLPLVRCANQYLAVLNCAKLGSDGFIAVPLHRLRNARYRRIDTDKFHIVDDAGIGAATMETLYIEAWDEGRERKNLPQLKTRVNMPYMEHSSYRLETVKTFPTSNFDDQGRPAFPMLLYNWERVGLMFCDEAKSFLVVLGQQSGTVWLRVKDPLQYASEWDEHPILAELKSVDKHRLSEKDFVGDYRRVPINGVGAQFVSVRTKLRRYGELLLVDLAIELSTP
jgi:hypothetical protein